MNRQKWWAFIEFALPWMGFCFTIISLSSYQWLVSGFCCRTGLFRQCQVVDMQCQCNPVTESFSWLSASAVFGIFATVATGGAVFVVLFGDTLWKQNLVMETKFGLRKKSKMISAILLAVSGFFLLISGSAFASNNSQTVSSLADSYPQSCPPALEYGYGFVFVWISFVLELVGCAILTMNSKTNKVSEADEQPPEQHSMEKVEEQPLEIPEHSEQNSEDVLASDNEVA